MCDKCLRQGEDWSWVGVVLVKLTSAACAEDDFTDIISPNSVGETWLTISWPNSRNSHFP